jgi:hypothetical protein
MLGTQMVLIALGTWIAIAPVVATVVGRALKAADPYSDVEYIRSAPPSIPPRRTVIARPNPIAPTPGPAVAG